MLSPNSPINPKSPNIAPFIEKSLFSPLHARITESSAQLAKLAGELKTELFGIDDVLTVSLNPCALGMYCQT